MRLGFCGAHRTGKSTLATQVAGRLGMNLAISSVSTIAKSYGFNMDTDRRDDPAFFAMQLHILDELEESFRVSNLVADRTPLDAAAYLLADVQANTGDANFHEAVLRYTDKAIRLTEELFDVVILIPPAISFDPVDGKPGGNLAYQEHHHLLCLGLQSELRLRGKVRTGVIERENLDLEDRIQAVADFVNPPLGARTEHDEKGWKKYDAKNNLLEQYQDGVWTMIDHQGVVRARVGKA